MLSVLLSDRKGYPKFIDICDNIKQVYGFFNDKRFDLINNTVDRAIEHCNEIKLLAVKNFDENIANSTYVVSNYLKLLKNYATYWKYLQDGDYRESWDILQNCIDCIICIKRFTENHSRYKSDLWYEHLKMLEKLYPYRVFSSIEMVIKFARCSICRRSIIDSDCEHIPGNLYWGELAYSIIEDAELQAVAMVNNPLDKRCVVEVQGDDRPKEEKFKLLHYFITNHQGPLRLFHINEIPRLYFNEQYLAYKRNDKCPCGSGKKFKNCCGKSKYKEGIHYRIVFNNGFISSFI
jgi:hypothetical protein